MFRKCSHGHEEVRWSMMAEDSGRCWFCGHPGDEHVALTITSILPPFMAGSAADRVASWVAGEAA